MARPFLTKTHWHYLKSNFRNALNSGCKNDLLFPQKKRTLFSPAYACDSEWEARKNSVALKDINSYEFLNSLIVRSQTGQTTSALDFDIAANCVSNDDQLPDLEELLDKFRHSKSSVSMLNSSHHALIRAYLQFNKSQKVMEFLSDTINYGIFPDWHAANLLMSQFLKAGDTRDAAKVACFMMQQEDFTTKSTRWLMLYSCLKWLQEPKPAEWVEQVQGQEKSNADDDEEIIFRIPFLKNRYFDDHFDLTEPTQLIGKTLALTAKYCLILEEQQQEQDRNLILNCKLLGLLLRNDSENLLTFLNGELKNEQNFRIYADLAEKLQNFKASKIDKENQAEKLEGEAKVESNELETEIHNMCQKFAKNENSLVNDFEKSILAKIPTFEREDVECQSKIYEHWNLTREKKINNQINRYLTGERLKIVQQEIESLKKASEHMFFFENKEKLEQKMPDAPIPAPIGQVQKMETPSKKAVVKCTRLSKKAMRKLARLKQTPVPTDEEYGLVPEVRRRAIMDDTQNVKY